MEYPHFIVIDDHIVTESQQGKPAILDFTVESRPPLLYVQLEFKLAIWVIVVYKTYKWNTVMFLILLQFMCLSYALFCLYFINYCLRWWSTWRSIRRNPLFLVKLLMMLWIALTWFTVSYDTLNVAKQCHNIVKVTGSCVLGINYGSCTTECFLLNTKT